MSGYEILSLDEIEPVSYLGSNLLPVRYHLDWHALGINAWRADAGGQLIPPHEEGSEELVEELYVVASGRATFTVGEEQEEAPAGSLVFVPPQVHRTAVAAEDGTIVLAVGASVGQPFNGGNWDTFAIADSLRGDGRVDEGRELLRKAREERPESWAMVYNSGCWEALAGNADAAFEHLRRAMEMNGEGIRPYLAEDSDLDSLRTDPRWQELTQ